MKHAPFTLEEMRRILENAPDNLRAFFAIGFFTGMRTGEIVALKWEDIDLKERLIHVSKSRRQGQETDPKTESSIREVDIVDALLPYLAFHRDISGVEGGYLFINQYGEPFSGVSRIRDYYWKPLLKKIGIEYRPIYHMRHSFATLMIENGEDILWVSATLGHKDSSMTLKRYAKYVRRNRKKRASFLLPA